MATFALVMSSLALLAATVSVIMTVMERKRSQERNTALRTALLAHTKVCVDDLEKRTVQQAAKTVHRVEELAEDTDKRLKALESGVVPDFEKAKEAADAVNSFNAGITGILGYDPYNALKAQRDRESRGEQT